MSEKSLRVKLGDRISGRHNVVMTNIPDLFQKIPGATDILNEVFSASLNRYQIYDKMVKRDSDLDAAITKISMLVRRAYQGIVLHPGESYSPEEKEFLKEAQGIAEKMRYPTLFQTIARRLMIDGDVLTKRQPIVEFAEEDGEFIESVAYTRYDFLPMTRMTAFGANQGPMNVFDEVSGPPVTYYYNESTSSVSASIEGGVGGYRTYSNSQIVHIPLGNLAEWVKDIEERNTWGVWSASPLESLRPIIYWRLSSMVNDMIWRRLYLPREHHELDLTDILDPMLYEGDNETEKKAAANSAATDAIKEYIKKLRGQMPDQGYVTPKVGDQSAVLIKIIEPKSTTYVSPNELLQQLASSINNRYFAKSTDSVSSSYAAEFIVSSDTQVAAEHISEIIKEYLLAELKYHFRDSEHKDKLDIRLQLIQPKDIENLIRMSAVLRSSAVTTIDEIRVRYLGLDPLTVEQREMLVVEMAMMRAGGNTQTIDQLTAAFIRRSPSDADREETPDSDKENQDT